MAIIRLAFIEFVTPFRKFHTGAPGGRDFVWLCLLLVLVLTFGLLLLATRVGLLERFVDVFLGSSKSHGVPVWVISNPISKGAVNFISNEVMEDVRTAGFSIYPYREIAAGLDVVELPDQKIWRVRSELDPEFSGWAVYFDDPLWSGPARKSSLPLQIVLNRSLFEKHFDFKAYRKVLQEHLPATHMEEIPEATIRSIPHLDRIWLSIRVDRDATLLPFDVTWADRIPAIENMAFLFPMSTYHALRAATNHPALRYFPEFKEEGRLRIRRIEILGKVEKSSLAKFSKALSGEILNSRGRTMVAFKTLRPNLYVTGFAKQFGLRFRILESVKGHAIDDRRTHLALPCSVVTRRQLRDMPKEKTKDSCMAIKDVTSTGNGFLRAFVYIPDRTLLNTAVSRLLRIHGHALSLHPIYQDALGRFAFLAKMLDTLRFPYGFMMIFILLAILGIQIGILVDHRRRRYGVFLAKGVAWYQLYLLIYLQILFALIVGFSGAITAMTVVRHSVSVLVENVADEFKGVLQVTNVDLLPLSTADYALTVLASFLLAILFSTVILYFLPVRPHTQIGPLLHD